jgi:hypothetical protein
MLSWILSEIDIRFLVEIWAYEEYMVSNIKGFVLWSTWNKKSYHRGIGGIVCYIKRNISSHIRLHKINPLNQYIWMEILDINAKNIYIYILQSIILCLLILPFIKKTI